MFPGRAPSVSSSDLDTLSARERAAYCFGFRPSGRTPAHISRVPNSNILAYESKSATASWGGHDNAPATVTLYRFTRSGGDTMQPNREPVGELKTNGASPNAVPAEGQLAGGTPAELHELLNALQSMRVGDFSVRMPGSETGILGKIADTFNEIVAANERMAQQLDRVGHVVGREGKTRQRVKFGLSNGAWGEMETSVNTLIDDLLWPTTEVTRVISAVAQGDLLQTVRLGRPPVHLEPYRLQQVALRYRRDDTRDLGSRPEQIVDQRVDRGFHLAPGAIRQAELYALAGFALAADDMA